MRDGTQHAPYGYWESRIFLFSEITRLRACVPLRAGGFSISEPRFESSAPKYYLFLLCAFLATRTLLKSGHLSTLDTASSFIQPMHSFVPLCCAWVAVCWIVCPVDYTRLVGDCGGSNRLLAIKPVPGDCSRNIVSRCLRSSKSAADSEDRMAASLITHPTVNNK